MGMSNDPDLRDRAIQAFTDAIERPHAGRVGEALDAVERWLRAELSEPEPPLCTVAGCTRSPCHYGAHVMGATGPHGPAVSRDR